jgi:hypothetical protein
MSHQALSLARCPGFASNCAVIPRLLALQEP